MSDWAPLKCAHCVDPIEVRDAVITIGLERFHVTCWHALTRAVSRRGRQGSEATRTRIGRAGQRANERESRRTAGPSP